MFGMNVTDPLFPSRSQISNNSNSSSPTSVAKLASITFVADPFITKSAHKEAAVPTAGSLISSATSIVGLSDFSQAQTDAIVAAINEISSAPSPHLWSFAQFLYLSAALSIATIVLPIIVGPIFRVTLRSFYKYKAYWRLTVSAFVLASTIILDIYIPPLPFEIIFGAPQIPFAIYKLVEAVYTGQQKKRWTGYATLLALCIVIDFQAPAARAVKIFIHYGKNVGLAAFIPTAYLFIIWIQMNPPLVSTARLLSWRVWVQRKIPPGLESLLMKYCKIIPSPYMTWILLFAINFPLALFLPGSVYTVATGVPFGLFALDKVITSVIDGRHLTRWIIFLFVVSGSIALDYFTPLYLIGISGLLPATYLALLHFSKEIWVLLNRRRANNEILDSILGIITGLTGQG